MSKARSCPCSAGSRHRPVSRVDLGRGSWLGFAILAGYGGEKARQIAPAIGDSFDRRAANRERLAADLLPAEALIKEARRVVAQHPDDRRAAADRDQTSEQCDQQAPSDTLVLPIRGDVEREHLAGEEAITAVRTAAAEAENGAPRIDSDPHVAGLAQDHAPPTELAPPLRQPHQIGGGQHAGIGRAPSLDIEPGDAPRVSWSRHPDRDLTHGRILPGFVGPGEWYGTAMTRYRRLCLMLSVLSVIPPAVPNVAAAEKKTAAAAAGSPSIASQRLGNAEGWTAFVYKEKSGQVCYLAGEPQKSEPANTKRKPPTAMVTHRPDEKVANVVSFVEGYPLKEGSSASLDIGGAKFDLFTKGDSAWAATADLDKTIVEAMAKGKQAILKGTPQNGKPTTDTYSLVGFAQALTMIDKACGIKR